jgi:hypothetical protein
MWAYIIAGAGFTAANFGGMFWLWKRSSEGWRKSNAYVDKVTQSIATDKTVFAEGLAVRIDDFVNQSEVAVRRNAALMASELHHT